MGWVARGWKHVLVTAALSTLIAVTATATVPAAAAPKVPGIDVSTYQGRIDWRAVATTRVRFVIMRATLGNEYRDGRYARNLAGARANGLVVGAYHFAKPGRAPWDPRAEAEHFLRVARVEAGDVLPVLDIEETGGLAPRELRVWARAWLDRVYARTGVRAMIYSGNHFWHGFMANTTWFGEHGHPLWVAHWYVGSPDVPGRRWAGRGYTVWQWSASGRVAGIRGDVDRDWVRGTLAQGTIASLTVRPAEGGVISGERIVCGGRVRLCSRLATPGHRIVLKAIPGPNARLIRWTGACAPADDARTCRISALRRKVVSAVFGHPIDDAIADVETGAASSNGPCGTGCPGSPSPGPRPTDSTEAPGRTQARACRSADPDCTIAVLLARQLDARNPEVRPAVPTSAAAPVPTPAASTAGSEPPTRPASVTPPTALATAADPEGGRRGDGDGTRFSWSRVVDERAIGGSYRWERRASASISYRFRGGTVTLFTVEGRAMGKARVLIDGRGVATIDGYARGFRSSVRHRFTGLGAGAHTLTVVPLGARRPAATDQRVAVDALAWGGRLHRDPAPRSAAWAAVDDPSASEGEYVVSDAPGAEARLTFSGTAVALRTIRGPARGRAQLWVDGEHVRTIDLYAPAPAFAWIGVATGLPEGPHVARVVVLGTRHHASEGNLVAIDRWVVAYRPERGRPATDGLRSR